MHHHHFSRTPGSTACDVDLFHATSLENSVFGAGPVSLIHEGFVPRKGSRVKAKLQLDAIFSPAMMFDHDVDQLAPVENFERLSDNRVTVIQNRIVAPSESMLSLVDDGSCVSDKMERSPVISSFPPPPRKPRVLVWIRWDLFIARRFTAADCFLDKDFERLPYAKSFSFARDWWSWRGGERRCGPRSSRWRQAEEVESESLVVGEMEVGSRALREIVCSKSLSLHKPRSLPKDLILPLVSNLSHRGNLRCLVILVAFSRCGVILNSKDMVHGRMHFLCSSCLR
jgi:hypothetical protein